MPTPRPAARGACVAKLPEETADPYPGVYATSSYSSSARNQSRITLASDMVFSDGASLELATMTTA